MAFCFPSGTILLVYTRSGRASTACAWHLGGPPVCCDSAGASAGVMPSAGVALRGRQSYCRNQTSHGSNGLQQLQLPPHTHQTQSQTQIQAARTPVRFCLCASGADGNGVPNHPMENAMMVRVLPKTEEAEDGCLSGGAGIRGGVDDNHNKLFPLILHSPRNAASITCSNMLASCANKASKG